MLTVQLDTYVIEKLICSYSIKNAIIFNNANWSNATVFVGWISYLKSLIYTFIISRIFWEVVGNSNSDIMGQL